MTRFVHPAPIVLHRQVRRNDYAANQIKFGAMPYGPRSRRSGRVRMLGLAAYGASIAIAVFTISWFAAALVSGAGQ